MNKKRLDFPIFGFWADDCNGDSHIFCYFDNASTSQKPQVVIDTLTTFYTQHNANTGRGIYRLGEQATTLYEAARKKIAAFIGAHDTSEIIFTRGATESINMVAHVWALSHCKKGDEIVVSQLEHHANLLPWQWVAQCTGASLRFIPVLPAGDIDYSSLATIITSKTRLVAITHVSNAIGTQVDIAAVIARAHVVGAYVLVDAAQSVPHQRINVAELAVDFLVFSGHKMLGPTGIGVLYIKKALHNQITPYQRGGGMVHSVTWQDAQWAAMPHRLEAGTPPIAQAIGLMAAVDYLEALDFNAIKEHEAALCTRLIDGLSHYSYIRIIGPIDQLRISGHIVAFVVEGMHAHDVAAILDTYGICVRAGYHCAQPLAHVLGYSASVRVSFYFYNTYEEVDMLIAAIEALTHVLK